MVVGMATITLKDIPDDIHAQLKAEAEANLRSLNSEALIRLQRSFEVQDRFSTAKVNALIDEALASGPAQRMTEAQLRERFNQVRKHTHATLAQEHQAR